MDIPPGRSSLVAAMEARAGAIVDDIGELVRCESPSSVPHAVALSAELVAAVGERHLAAAPELLGLPPLTAVAVGGASDGNFTAAVGTPTLDGLGAVGGGAHADHEYVLVNELPGRAALLAALIEDVLIENVLIGDVLIKGNK